MTKKNEMDNVTLDEWFKEPHSEDDKRKLFLYMDSAMKYVHEMGLCVNVFDPKKIELLNSSLEYVKFDELYDLEGLDYNVQQKIINKDIFKSAIFQILLYSKFDLKTNTSFVKEHFDEFTSFLSEKDIPYYRGVVERNASVYFIEYEAERVKREASDIEKELNGNDSEVKDNKELEQMLSNNKVNRLIYGDNLSKAAFINILLYPTIMIILVLVISYLVFLLRYFGL